MIQPDIAAWDINLHNRVSMSLEDTVNYQLRSTEADAQWAALTPHEGVVHIGSERRPFMPSVFHQLHCLNIIRLAYVNNTGGELDLVGRHCLNYLRQMLLCRTDLNLEPVVDPGTLHMVRYRREQTCRDWRVVYHELKGDREAYVTWHSGQQKTV